MTAAAASVGPSVSDNGLNGVSHGHVTMNMPRFHPIAMNPNTSGPPPPDPMMQAQYRPYPVMEHGPPSGPPGPHGPPPVPTQLEQIEARLRQLEHEDAARMAARSQQLAIRKREDEEFRRVTECAEAEEEELRRQRKRLKRESMGLVYNSSIDSPPRATPPRRLSETNAATTLAFFKQQSPPEPLPAPPPPVIHDPNAGGPVRKKQKYTIKNVEAWGERHGRPAAHDPSGRALWKRPSDGALVYLSCPAPGCRKSDFLTLHGFMCHLTKKHKDRSLGSQSRALDLCGIVYDPNAPLPHSTNVHRASTEDSRSAEGYQQELEYSSGSEDEENQESPYPIKKEEPISNIQATQQGPPSPVNAERSPRTNGSTKQTISSIIDANPEPESRKSTPPAEVSKVESQTASVNGTSERTGSQESGKQDDAKNSNEPAAIE
ncbi:hypothetical protein VTN00DRAFT_316 [Thermoascus crustaceus]|uniref:uncharacterized protein n=1 Tax=Thermoascus crustaceus TaxID=5088 RepID=UPI003744766B